MRNCWYVFWRYYITANPQANSGLKDLLQGVLHNWQQAVSVCDLHWSDLSKALYLADELINGIRQADVELDITIGEHPILNSSIGDTYQVLFIASSSGVLPADFNYFQEHEETSNELINSFS